MTRFSLAAILVATAFLALPVAAQQPTQAQRDAIKSACRSDFMAQCSGVTPGGQAALSCLQQHSATLSQPCQQAVGALSGGAAGKSSTTGTTGGAKAPATAATPAAPAAPAATATKAMPTFTPREELMILRETCGPNFRAYCSGVPLGGGRGIACLRQNMARLSPGCKKVLTSGL